VSVTFSTRNPISTRRSTQASAAAPRGHQPHLGERFSLHQKPVPHRRGNRDRGAVLVVMKHRDLHPGAEIGLDRETLRRLDVLEIDRPERRLQRRDDVAETLRIGGIDLDIEDIDAGEFLEQDRLALHHRLARERPDIAEAEHRRAVGDDGDEIAARGQIIGGIGIGDDRIAGGGDPGRIGQRQIALRRHALGRDDGELARLRQPVVIQRRLANILVHRHPLP
jgi:hypothetical protein